MTNKKNKFLIPEPDFVEYKNIIGIFKDKLTISEQAIIVSYLDIRTKNELISKLDEVSR